MNYPTSFIALDFETATPDRNSACQLGMVLVKEGVIEERVCLMIQPPGNEYARMNKTVHGISEQDTLSAPTFDKLWPEISLWINNYPLVCHNAVFDMSVLTQTCEYYGVYEDLQLQGVFCTYRMTDLSLVEACQAFGVAIESHHNALADAEMCARIFLQLAGGRVPDLTAIKVPKGGKKGSNEEVVENFSIKQVDFFQNKATLVTGVFGSFSRDDIRNILMRHGAIMKSSISSKLQIVVKGMDAGPCKMRRIEEMIQNGAPLIVIEEDELLDILGRDSN